MCFIDAHTRNKSNVKLKLIL
uniref:CSON007747 protein n=1 Tax=Culicoides sonorensis TaxID=179676 RepID=A0A336LBR3_CULSO